MSYRRIHNAGPWRAEEAAAAGTITPGMLVEYTTSGTIQAHATEGGRHERLVALEDALQGRAVATDYSATELVSMALVAPGTVMNMLIASGEACDIGDELVSAGDGTLINADSLASASLAKQIVGRAVEAFTTLGANTLKAVRFV